MSRLPVDSASLSTRKTPFDKELQRGDRHDRMPPEALMNPRFRQLRPCLEWSRGLQSKLNRLRRGAALGFYDVRESDVAYGPTSCTRGTLGVIRRTSRRIMLSQTNNLEHVRTWPTIQFAPSVQTNP